LLGYRDVNIYGFYVTLLLSFFVLHINCSLVASKPQCVVGF